MTPLAVLESAVFFSFRAAPPLLSFAPTAHKSNSIFPVTNPMIPASSSISARRAPSQEIAFFHETGKATPFRAPPPAALNLRKRAITAAPYLTPPPPPPSSNFTLLLSVVVTAPIKPSLHGATLFQSPLCFLLHPLFKWICMVVITPLSLTLDDCSPPLVPISGGPSAGLNLSCHSHGPPFFFYSN